MIPEAAVEAAAKVMQANDEREGFGNYPLWEYAEDVNMILEAAAPHMLAEAFEQGQKSGMRHADRLVAAAKIGRPDLPGPISPNPYRPTP